MGRQSRRIAMLVLCAALLIGMLAACSGRSSENRNPDPAPSSSSNTGGSDPVPETAEESQEIAYPDSFTYWLPADPNVLAVMSNIGAHGASPPSSIKRTAR